MLDVPEEARTPIGTGPFKFQEWDYGRSFKAVKYADYWRTDEQGRRLPYLDSIEFRPIPDPQLRTDSLLDADVDMLITAALPQIERLEEAPNVKVLTYSEGEEQYVALNTAKPPFDDETARRAVALATDQAAVRERMSPEFAVPANSQWAPGQLGYREDSGQIRTDPDAARAAVADYTARTGQPLAFTLIASQNLESQRLQQILKEQWEAAGMQVSLETVPQADLVVRFALGNYQAGISRLFGFPEPDTDHFFMHSRSIDPNLISFNLPRYANPELDAALDRARSSTDETVRDEAYATVARLMNEHVPVVWLYRPTWAIASNLQVHGYGAAANGTIQTIGPKTWVATLFKS
jgi:peptide/nickel transport system substrate-binding protein